ncbi:MAG: hypothetical protein A2Y21_00555 [Clostridiales bacterium GWC2_40_7]|nr:MAG: hypothetical protein A2Y21_00555 [Clostridiales bacterium GWC2_40_7]
MPVDRQYYMERLRDFLPERIIDIHTHIWLNEFKTEVPNPSCWQCRNGMKGFLKLKKQNGGYQNDR